MATFTCQHRTIYIPDPANASDIQAVTDFIENIKSVQLLIPPLSTVSVIFRECHWRTTITGTPNILSILGSQSIESFAGSVNDGATVVPAIATLEAAMGYTAGSFQTWTHQVTASH